MDLISGNRSDWRKRRKKPSEAKALTPREVLCRVPAQMFQHHCVELDHRTPAVFSEDTLARLGEGEKRGWGWKPSLPLASPTPRSKMPRIAPRSGSPSEFPPNGSGLSWEELGSI